MAPIEEKPGGVDTEQGHAVGAQPGMEAFTPRRMVVGADIGDTADTVADVWASSPRRPVRLMRAWQGELAAFDGLASMFR